MKQWIVLVAILMVTIYSGFMFGGAYVSNKYEKKFNSLTARFNYFYEKGCNVYQGNDLGKNI